MKAFVSKVKKVFNKFLGMFPSPLPVGLNEYNAWAKSIIDTYDLASIADEDSIKFVLSTNILHMDMDRAYVPKWVFAKRIRKGAANQVSSAVFQEIKQKQADKAKAEATAAPVASDGQK